MRRFFQHSPPFWLSKSDASHQRGSPKTKCSKTGSAFSTTQGSRFVLVCSQLFVWPPNKSRKKQTTHMDPGGQRAGTPSNWWIQLALPSHRDYAPASCSPKRSVGAFGALAPHLRLGRQASGSSARVADIHGNSSCCIFFKASN